jgi:hypothetical protein
MTDAEAVAYFGPLTLSYIPCGDLENLLGWAGLATRNPVTGAWEGSLIDFMNGNTVPALSVGLSSLFSHLNKPRSTGVDTNLQPWASSMEDLFNGLIAVGQVDAAFKADVVALAGGYANEDLDEAAVAVIRADGIAAEEARIADEAYLASQNATKAKYDELYNQHIAPLYSAKDMTDASWIAALQAMSSNWSV